ncbi:MAG TPA: hypothetical protein HA367_06125 [Candidatus Methanofastidiosum sp.]|nr:hypothetical protein [Methanofastidiosum sp.]
MDHLAFNTKYKSGDILLCIQDVVYNGVTIFHANESYSVNSILYSRISLGDKTRYKPNYLVNDCIPQNPSLLDTSRVYVFFSPEEEFIKDEKNHGASGMSSHGNIDIHFKSSIIN